MPKCIMMLLYLVSVQAYINAENITSTSNESVAIKEDIKEENVPEIAAETDTEDKGDDMQGQRQKRYFEYGINAGVASYNPVLTSYPSYVKRDNTQTIGLYDTSSLNEITLSQIYKRLQEIANIAKRQYLPPVPPRPVIPIPTYIPFHVYVPGARCGCESPSPETTPLQTDSNSPKPTTSNPTDYLTETQTVEITKRVGEDEDGDGSRPISFTPIGPKRNLKRPPPPVEHGSFQAGVESSINRYPSESGGSLAKPAPIPKPEFVSNSDVSLNPTPCDAAVLSCCHQSQVSNECFSSKGCTDPTVYADPCNRQTLLNVVNKYQEIYKIRAG